MDPRKTIAAIASGLSVALLAASLLRDTRQLHTPHLQNYSRSSATRGSACREAYSDRFYDPIFKMSPDIACRPQLPSEEDCKKALQVNERKKGKKLFVSENRKRLLRRERSGVSECNLPKGSLHCWHKLTKHWFHKDAPRPMDNCIIIYSDHPTSPSPSPASDNAPPFPSPNLPYPPPTPFPSMSTVSNQPQLITHPFIYSAGLAAMAGILPRLAPLPSGTNSSYIYLVCNSSRHYPANIPLQRLMVVNLYTSSTSEHQGLRGSSSHINIKVTVLPGVSRAAFFRNYPLSTHTLQEMEEVQGAAILDFTMHQTSGPPKGIRTFVREFISDISNYSSQDHALDENFPIFLTGILLCKGEATHLKNSTFSSSDQVEAQDTENTISQNIVNYAIAIDNFMCSAVNMQHSWWNSSELVHLQTVSDHVTSLQMGLLEHFSKRGKFSVSVSVVWQLQEPRSTGNHVNADKLVVSHIQQLGGSMSKTIHILLSDGGTIYHHNSRHTSYTRLEESNPVLLFIIPQTAKLLMPKLYFENLEVNSNRIVTTADVALTVFSLNSLNIDTLLNTTMRDRPEEITPRSLALKALPVSHSCESLAVQAPNLCICEGEWTPADSDTMYVGLAELAVVSLNGIIRQQAVANATEQEPLYSSSPYSTCLKLVGISFYDVQVRREGTQLVTRMSLIVAQKTFNVHAQGATPLTDSFQVTLGSDFSRQEVGEMRMLGYVRISNIGGRRGCSVGTGVDPDLCLCVPGAHRHAETPDSILHHLQLTQFGVRPKLLHLHHPCLILSIRQYGDSDSVIFTAVNTCDSYTYKVTLRVVAVNVIQSHANPNTAVIHPLCEVTLNVVMRVSYYTPSSKVGYQVSYTFIED